MNLENACAKKDSQEYDKVDGIISIVFYIFDLSWTWFWFSVPGFLLKYNFCNILSKNTAFINLYAIKGWEKEVSNISIQWIPVLVIIIILALRKQNIFSLGFRKNRNLYACILGIIAGIIMALLMICISLVGTFFDGYHDIWKEVSLLKFHLSTSKLLSYIFSIGMTEELCFRAFIQTRIAGLIHNRWVSTLTVGFMFWTLHIPVYLSQGSLSVNQWIVRGAFLICFHIWFLFLYKKTDNILSSIICHGIYDYIIEYTASFI